MGETGEAYAFDRRGVLLTATRFDEQLKKLGLIPNVPEATAILNLRLTDPGVLLEEEARPSAQFAAVAVDPPGTNTARPPRFRRPPGRAGAPPLTRMAESATHGESGVDVHGYRNYRGQWVVGAWTWLPEYGLGVATEVAAAEAFQTLYLLRKAFLVLFSLLVVSGVGIFSFTLVVERLEASVRKSALTAKRLGQYVLVQEIGRGANGMVYRARHSLLRRPVAIKLLSPDLTNESSAARFEHEAQMTSQLTHPNTVAIYDYGRTPEGLFYYAMEYLSGIDLDQLVRQFGPQPEGRVIHILRQACGSLAEAHRIGLIHRDIKPANIVLTRRGGVADLAKVLDFGLVKRRRQGAGDTRSAWAIVGTPHFMAPEAIEKPESVDGRSDLYSLGAVAYWLLTGETLFKSQDVEELLKRQVKDAPPSLSDRLGRPVSADLDELILRCLAKSPADRPADIQEFDAALSRCASAGTWPPAAAEGWWKTNLAGIEISPAATMAEKTLVIAPRN
jgi:tRNA A-37 threonylcarbamoyl transferase component Bud32